MDSLKEQTILTLLRDETQKKQGFGLLVKEMTEPLYWQIRKMVLSHEDTNDILQNTFIKAWSSIDRFRGEASISTWMFRIAINETYSFLNKERLRNQSDFTDLEDSMALRLQGDAYFSGNELARKLQEAILTLPEKQRLVFNMKYYDDLKYEEISDILGTSVGALKASYHYAVKKIEAYIKADF